MSTLSWERVGSRFFNILDGPVPRWNLKFENFSFKASPHGGIIAAYPRSDILVRKAIGDENSKPQLHLMGSNGFEYGAIDLDFGNVLDVACTVDEDIIVSTDQNIVRHYSNFGKNFVQFKPKNNFEEIFIANDGYAAIAYDENGNVQLWYVSGIKRVSPKLKQVFFDGNIETWTFVSKNPGLGRLAGFFIVDSNRNGIWVDFNSNKQQIVYKDLPNKAMVLNPDQSLIACADSQKLVLIPIDLSGPQSYDFHAFNNLGWVGNNSLYSQTDGSTVDLYVWDKLQLETANIVLDDDQCVLLTEHDGLRMLSSMSHSLILSVPKDVASTLKLGSVAPSAVLYSSVDFLDKKSPRAIQIVKSFDKLTFREALDACLNTALFEFDTRVQKRLLRAVSFAKLEDETYNSMSYVDALNDLRILNALRSLEVPLFLTNLEMKELNLVNLLSRLQNRQLWAEAVSIARISHAPLEPIYSEWGCNYIQTHHAESNEDVLNTLNAKLERFPTISYTKMVYKAIEEGRQSIATILLSKQPVIKDRVLLLLEMNDFQTALDEATKLGDCYLVDYVLILLNKQLDVPQLMRLLGNNSLAIKRQHQLLEVTKPPAEVRDFLYNMDLRETGLWLDFNEIKNSSDLTTQITSLKSLGQKFNNSTESNICVEWSELIAIQTKLSEDFRYDFVGKSSVQTISDLFKLGHFKQAHRLRGKLGIGERQFWWIQLRVLIEQRQFDKVWELANSKKSPIGYKPFFDMCLQASNLDLAGKFVAMIPDLNSEEKVELYLKTGWTDQAREVALKSKSQQLIQLVEN